MYIACFFPSDTIKHIMQELSIALQLGLALILGGVIGLEREINEKRVTHPDQEQTAIIGIRTFSLVGLLGGLAGLLYVYNNLVYSILISSTFMVLVIVYYILDSINTKDLGFTTELATIFTFLLGVLLTLNIIPIQIILAIGVLLILLLSRKRQIKKVVKDVGHQEVNAFVSYAIIAVVILPFLPNESYALVDIPFIRGLLTAFGADLNGLAELELINPFRLWLIVALITGVEIVGYILERTLGHAKGWILTSIAGGFISSTAVTQSLAQESKESKHVNVLLASALVANLTSFFQVGIIIASVNSIFFISTLGSLIPIIISALVLSVFFLFKKSPQTTKKTLKHTENHEIFNMAPALKFAGLFLVINVVSQIALFYFGQAGFLATSGIGALVGIDAVMINTATLAGKTISAQTGVMAFIIINAVNLLGKTFYSFLQGKREFAVKFGLSVVVIIASSLIGLLFV